MRANPVSLFFFLAVLLVNTPTASAATITIVNLDGANEGFNDPAAATPVGGNNGTTVGQQRLIVFQRAAEIWGATIVSSVPILVGANFDPLDCTATSGILGSAGAVSFFRDFAGAPLPNTWYPVALANALAGVDLDPGSRDISATFNSEVGKAGCLSTLSWYSGLDGNAPANSIDLLDTILHELAHGLGFVSTVNLTTGARLNGFNDTYMRHFENHSTGEIYPDMTDAERVAASIATENLHWIGSNVVAMSGILSAGSGPGGHVEMYAPNPAEPGSSVSHFSTTLTPNELMEPFATATSDRKLTVELFKDIGWTVLPAPPSIITNGATITAETCAAPGGSIDPGETVTVSFSLRNVGTIDTINLVAGLQALGGVLSPSGPQTYGVLAAQGAALTRSFTFTADGACGGLLNATLQLQDGTNDLGTVTFPFKLGSSLSFTNSGNINVPRSGAASPYPSTLAISGLPPAVNGVTVRLFNINHGTPDDLDILLVGPAGQTVVLMSDTGAGNDLSDVTLLFDDAAAASLPDSAQIVSGAFKPTNIGSGDSFPAPAPAGPHGATLSVFDGTTPNGVWSLYVIDDSNPRSGSIDGGWSLTFPTCCTNAAPVLTLPGGAQVYEENSAAVVLDSTATVSDADSSDLNMGALAVSFSADGTADDRLTVRHEGSGPGQIGLAGSAITHGGLLIGTFSGGTNGSSPLVINFTTTTATPAAAQALLRNIAFANVSENPSVLPRTVSFVLGDGDGGTSLPATLTVNVTAVNDPPTLSELIDQAIDEDASTGAIAFMVADAETSSNDLMVSVSSSNTNLVPPTRIVLGGTGANRTVTIGPATNQFGASMISVSVGDGADAVERSFLLTVNPVNDAPTLAPIPNQIVTEENTLIFTNVAADVDLPANVLAFHLEPGAPAGATLDSTNSVFAWTPAEDQGPSTNTIIVVVADDGAPSLSATQSFVLIVLETNSAPILDAIQDQTIYAGTTLSFTNTAMDLDVPANLLTYSLSNAPAGASIGSEDGIFSWSAADETGTNVIAVVITDDGNPNLSDTQMFTVTVASRPIITSIEVDNGNVIIIWSAVAGKKYRLQYKSTLADSDWTDIEDDVTANGATATKTVILGAARQRFYRIQALP